MSEEVPQEGRRQGDTPPSPWPLLLIAAPAAAAVWSGWVGLGEMTGFGLVKPFPGISEITFDSAITLPIGVEAYGAVALVYALSNRALTPRTRWFAGVSAGVSLGLGAAGQVAYHLLEAAGRDAAPWQITAAVAVLPVVVLGAAAALYHMVRADAETSRSRAGAGESTGTAEAPVPGAGTAVPVPVRDAGGPPAPGTGTAEVPTGTAA